MDHAKLDVIRRVPVNRCPNRVLDSRPILRVNQRGEVLHAAGSLASFDAQDLVDTIRPFLAVPNDIPIPNPDLSGVKRQLQTFFAPHDRLFRPSARGYIAKYQNYSQDAPMLSANRRRAVFDRNIAPIPGAQHGVISEVDHSPIPDDFVDRNLSRKAGSFVRDDEHLGYRLPGGILLAPARQSLRDHVQEGHVAVRIRGNNRVANTGKRDLEQFPIAIAPGARSPQRFVECAQENREGYEERGPPQVPRILHPMKRRKQEIDNRAKAEDRGHDAGPKTPEHRREHHCRV